MIGKKLFLGMFLIVVILIFASFASAYVRSNVYSSQYNRAMGIGIFSGGQSLKVDESMCQQGTDFIIQINPLGCSPTVVRSDLLEEENVNVFCQLTALQINPFVDVSKVDWISFKEEYPKEVLAIGYQPAQAALGYTPVTGLQGSAFLENLGYVVITLRRQPNESALTNCKKAAFGLSEICWVEGNLTAKLTYNVENSFGVGEAIFYLPVMDDEDWEDNHIQYGFWRGRGYLRAEAVDENGASISIYSDNSVASSLSIMGRQYNLAKYRSDINLNVGETSPKIFLPGLSPCLASLQLYLEGIENPDTRAELKVNDDYFEVVEGGNFFNNKCTVLSIDKKGLNSKIKIQCKGDTSEDKKPFYLRIFPSVNLSINGKTGKYKVGDFLYQTDSGSKSVYLGYVGTKDGTERVEDLYVYLVALPVRKVSLTESEISSVANHAEAIEYSSGTGAAIWDKSSAAWNEFAGRTMAFGKTVIRGEQFSKLYYKKGVISPAEDVQGSSVSLKGFANAEDNGFMTLTTKDYPLAEGEQKDISSTVTAYFFEESDGVTSDMFLVKSDSGTPRFLLQKCIGLKEDGACTRVTVGTFYGESCTVHETCLKYSLALSDVHTSGNENFFDGVVSAEIIPKENKLIVTRASFSEFEDEGKYQEYYENAMSDFETVVNSYSNEVEKENSVQTLGEKSLYQEILLAEAIGQRKTMLELCRRFVEDYPDSLETLEICRDVIKLANSENSVKELTINGFLKRISFEGVKEPSIEEYSARLIVEGPSDKEEGKTITKYFDLRKNKIISLDEFRMPDSKIKGTEYITLESLETSSAVIKMDLNRANVAEKLLLSNSKILERGVPRRYEDYTFTLSDIRLEKVAKVVVKANTDFATSNSSFTFKIGVEKRAMPLSPEKAQEKIDSLNKRIEDWQKRSDVLYGVVKTMKLTCTVTGGALVVKNLWLNRGGKATARQLIMAGKEGKGGWNDKCAELVPKQYGSIDKCFLANSETIEGEVNNFYSVIQLQNSGIANLEKGSTDSVFIDKYSESVTKTLNSGVVSTALNSLPEEKKKNINLQELTNVLNSANFYKEGVYTLDQLKEIELYSLYLGKYGSSDSAYKTATNNLYSVLYGVQINSKESVEEDNFEKKTGMTDNTLIGSFESLAKMNVIEISASKRMLFKNTEYYSFFMEIQTPINEKLQSINSIYAYAVKDSKTSKEYLLLYDNDGVVVQTYQIVIEEGTEVLKLYRDSERVVNINPLSLQFEKYDAGSFKNKYKSSYGKSEPLVIYYETSPYKGKPAVVPFDFEEGWYAGVDYPGISYADSGVVKRFYLCNVGEDGVEAFQVENPKFGGDHCQLYDFSTGVTYTEFDGLGDRTKELVDAARNAINTAQNRYREGVSSVYINTKVGKVKVGEPAFESSGTKCTDFMSIKDCTLLFNLCDPVVCPSSRCDLGGKYHVKNVIQSGIIGSLALCLPNWKPLGGDVYIPVCLSGVQTGIDAWISVLEDYRDCLQTSIDTGETVGICDEMYSRYVCQFFWKESLPVIKLLGSKLIDKITGQSGKGGGEYQGLNSALKTAQDSIDYFKQYYAENSYKAFKARSTEEIGTDLICGTFISAVFPGEGSFLDNLIEPDSPFQYTGKFQEIQLTTTTNPPTSQYKVSFHIYAGRDSGAYYTVYLRGSGSSYYQDTAENRLVKSGYIPRGDSVSESVDFTAPSGYQKLCIVVNGQEECGFKEVSTSFAVNYLSDMYLKEQASKTDIKTEKECKSGTASLYSLLNVNVQSIAENLIDPELYAQGIVRICSTVQPGVGTDVNVENKEARYEKVGYCGEPEIGCWIDKESVKDAIYALNLEKDALDAVSDDTTEAILAGYLTPSGFSDAMNEIKKAGLTTKERIELVTKILTEVYLNNQKAQLFFWRGIFYSELAQSEYDIVREAKAKAAELARLQAEEEQGRIVQPGEIVLLIDIFNAEYVSPIFEFEDGTSKQNTCYKYFDSKWHWMITSTGSGTMIKRTCNDYGRKWLEATVFVELAGINNEIEKVPTDKSIEFIKSLQGKSYFDGLELLIARTVANDEGGSSKPDITVIKMDTLTKKFTEISKMSNEGIFKINIEDEEPLPLYYRYLDANYIWQWSLENPSRGYWTNADTFVVSSGTFKGDKQTPESIELTSSLEGRIFYEGAAILFDPTSKEVKEVFGIGEGVCDNSLIGEKILSIAVFKIGGDTTRVESGSVVYGNVCATFVSNVLIEAGALPEFSSCSLETTPYRDNILELINLFKKNNFAEIDKTGWKSGLKAGDFIILGASGSYDREFQHITIFHSYVGSGFRVVHDGGKDSKISYRTYSDISGDDWWITHAWRAKCPASSTSSTNGGTGAATQESSFFDSSIDPCENPPEAYTTEDLSFLARLYSNFDDRVQSALEILNKFECYYNKRIDGKMTQYEIDFKEKIVERVVGGQLYYTSNVRPTVLLRMVDLIEGEIPEEATNPQTKEEQIYWGEFKEQTGDHFRVYLGLPKKGDTLIFTGREIVPTKEEDKTSQYYGYDPKEVIKTMCWNSPMIPIDDMEKISCDTVPPFFKIEEWFNWRGLLWANRLTTRQLVRHITTVGFDEKRNEKYISYYDIWDLDPPGLVRQGINIDKYNFPFEIYGRLYESDFDQFPRKWQDNFPKRKLDENAITHFEAASL